MHRPTLRLATLILVLGIPAHAALQTYSPALPLVLSSDTVPTLAEGGIVSSIFNCQPKLFNPGTVRLKANDDGTYQVPGLDYGLMTVQMQSLKEYALTEYRFICNPNIVSHVLELRKNGKRHALYTHVVGYALSADQKYLYLDNYLPRKNGQWQHMHRIITLATKKSVSIPHSYCTLSRATWSQGKLITHASTAWGSHQEFCIWEPNGSLSALLRGNLVQSANDEAVLAPHGLLPKEQDTFYAVHTNFETRSCTLILQQLKGAKKQRTVKLELTTEEIGACTWDSFEMDLSKATFQKTPVRFRTRINIYTPWGSWK
jgi:hypothetical protein